MADAIFDIALDKRFTDSQELLLVDVSASDVLLIHDSTSGLVYRIQAGTLASFINAAIGSADILDALNAPNGVATLDTGGRVPAAQLPAYVDDALEYATVSAFPATGEAGKIYVARVRGGPEAEGDHRPAPSSAVAPWEYTNRALERAAQYTNVGHVPDVAVV